jgi:hypothetical protein
LASTLDCKTHDCVTVYVAFHDSVKVAAKVIDRDRLDWPSYERGIQVVKSISHPNLITILD